jgi:hypothetical protein
MITPDENAARAADFRELKWSLQALAFPASDQPGLFPQFAASPDQLALDFEHWASVVKETYEEELSSAQLDALAAISRTLQTISGHAAEFEAELWTEEAVRSSSHWDDIRRVAAAALEVFGWRMESHPRNPGDLAGTLPQP